jgi:hypothetical protein
MHIMDFYPCKVDPDVWMKDCDTHYEYVLVYVDDLMFIGKKPQAFFDSLTTEHGFKLKGVGKPSYHLGGGYFCDSDGTLAWRVQNVIQQVQPDFEIRFPIMNRLLLQFSMIGVLPSMVMLRRNFLLICPHLKGSLCGLQCNSTFSSIIPWCCFCS